MPILTARALTKTYNNKVYAVSGIDLVVYSGEIISLLGPNGAGKSTTIKMLLGLELPSQGEIEFLGFKPGHKKVRKSLGCTPQDTDFPLGVTVLEVLKLVSHHYDSPMNLKECLNRFQLTELRDRKTHQMSGGQKRCLALACAFIGRPKLVLLDEPTTGLDVNTRSLLWKEIKRHRSEGGAALLSTHYLAEAEAISDKIVMIHKGRVLQTGSVDEIKASVGFKRVRYSMDKEQHNIVCHDSDRFVREKIAGKEFENLEISPVSLEEAFIHILEGEK